MEKIAKIIPLRKLPKSLDCFDYLIPERLEKTAKIGSIAEINFKNQKIHGLIYKIAIGRSNFKLKPINRIFSNELITSYQIKLIKWFSEYYHYSLASTAGLFVPQIPKKKIQIKSQIEKVDKKFFDQPANELKKTINQIQNAENSNYLLINQNIDITQKLYLNLINQHLINNEQILILFPTLAELNYFYEKLNDKIKKICLILDRKYYKSGKNRHLRYYRLIAENKAKVLLGTRSAVFFNLKNTKNIIIDRAEADEYKQWDQRPRYETNRVLLQIIKILPIKLIISGFCPKVKIYYQAKQKKFKLMKIGKDLPEKQVQRVEFSRGADNYYLTPNLNQFIEKGLAENEKILLIVNKRGYAGSLKCLDCGRIIKCQTCYLPLTVYSNNTLFCHHCLKYQSEPEKCSRCKSINLRPIGIGAIGFENLIKEKYNSKNITVGLPSIYSTEFEKYDRAAFVYFDSLFYLPDYTHSFKIYYLLRKFSYKLFSQNPQIKILIQSNFLDNYAVSEFNGPLVDFYQKELKLRKNFDYPPYATLIKIIVQSKMEQQAKSKIQNIYNKISKINSIQVSAPYPAYSRKIRNYFAWQLIIKIFDKKSEEKLAKMLPDDIIIDKDPVNLL